MQEPHPFQTQTNNIYILIVTNFAEGNTTLQRCLYHQNFSHGRLCHTLTLLRCCHCPKHNPYPVPVTVIEFVHLKLITTVLTLCKLFLKT